MNTKANLTIILSLMCTTIFAQNQGHYIGFVARDGSIAPVSAFGHAFVIIGKGPVFTCNESTFSFGFYLKEDSDAVLGLLPGEIRDDDLAKISEYEANRNNTIPLNLGEEVIWYHQQISESEYNKLLQRVEYWKNFVRDFDSYDLFIHNCIDFTVDMANQLDRKPILPQRYPFQKPWNFMAELAVLNLFREEADYDSPEVVVNSYNQLNGYIKAVDDCYDTLGACDIFASLVLTGRFAVSGFFSSPNGQFESSRSAIRIIMSSPNWKYIGTASDQSTLSDVQNKVNSGRAVVGIYQPQNMLVIGYPGELTLSGWNVKVPHVSSYSRNSSRKFHDGLLSKAFGEARRPDIKFYYYEN